MDLFASAMNKSSECSWIENEQSYTFCAYSTTLTWSKPTPVPFSVCLHNRGKQTYPVVERIWPEHSGLILRHSGRTQISPLGLQVRRTLLGLWTSCSLAPRYLLTAHIFYENNHKVVRMASSCLSIRLQSWMERPWLWSLHAKMHCCRTVETNATRLRLKL